MSEYGIRVFVGQRFDGNTHEQDRALTIGAKCAAGLRGNDFVQTSETLTLHQGLSSHESFLDKRIYVLIHLPNDAMGLDPSGTCRAVGEELGFWLIDELESEGRNADDIVIVTVSGQNCHLTLIPTLQALLRVGSISFP